MTVAPETPPPFETPPEVWDYDDPRAFVRDLSDWKKEFDPGFSFRQLCRFAEFGSPSYVKTYLDNKRNLKHDSADKLAYALGLGEPERAYFGKLVELDQEETQHVRQTLRLELLRSAVRHGHTSTLNAAKLDYFSHWFIPVIHAMASLRSFKATPHWIAARLRPKIRSYDAKLAIDILVELGLLEEKNGTYSVSERRLAVDTELQSSLVAEYLGHMLRLSEQATQFWDASQRVNSALTVTVPDAIYDDVLARIETFREELFDYIMAEQTGQKGVAGQVVHVGFQAFKVTDIEHGGGNTDADPEPAPEA